MSIYNPYRNYEKGMDDAYMGRTPQRNSEQYEQGYERALQLEEEEWHRKDALTQYNNYKSKKDGTVNR